ncbi:hypothetical protein CBR_g34528 [Chara braunii]|uniref:Uncharacterized protein n=1 Tax=Chara braunii TaxID=69332 RepID=A0A388LJ32_CHABU|nr:hypothetical protein CBR_g34528 [Chara braunii]|eukprot:GBG82245.1 hypothetical protein CBR_g34528 [Chara braunii]
MGGSPYSGREEVCLGKRRRVHISPNTGDIGEPGNIYRSPFPSLLGSSPLAVQAVRNPSVHDSVLSAPLLSSPLLPRRLDYGATVPVAPVWTHAVGPTCLAGGAAIMPFWDDVAMQTVCRLRSYDSSVRWPIQKAIRAELGGTIVAAISATLPSRKSGPDFRLGYVSTQDGSQSSFPRSRHGSQRSETGRGRPHSADRSTAAPAHPQTWSDCWDGVSQFGPVPDRDSVEEAMGLWVGPKVPDVVLLEPVKMLQLLGLFHLYCLWHGDVCCVHVESISYPAQLCQLILVCDRRCKWMWHSTLVTTNVYFSRLQQQLYYATVTTGLTYTLLDNFLCALGMCSVHKPTFYKFMRIEVDMAKGWNSKVCRQGLQYCQLAIDTVMRRGESITLMVDGWYDSARFAQYCIVTPIEYETRLVVGVHTLRPKAEGKASNALEVPAVVRLLRGLLKRGLKIRCVVSDGCAALGPQLRAMNIECQKDYHHKIKNIRKHFRFMLKLKVAKKMSNRHRCVSESRFMNFTKELMEALNARFEPGTSTLKEEWLKKLEFVAVVMQNMYPYGSMTNDQQLIVDPDGVTEFHVHEVGMWFLRACELCRNEGGDADSCTTTS